MSAVVVAAAAAAHPHIVEFNIVLPLTELFVWLRSLRRDASLERLNLRTRWKNMAAIKKVSSRQSHMHDKTAASINYKYRLQERRRSSFCGTNKTERDCTTLAQGLMTSGSTGASF